MIHRNLTTSEWTLMALESVMERGRLVDWREFARALNRNEQLARDALRVSENDEDRASASLARVLVFGRFPGLAPDGGDRTWQEGMRPRFSGQPPAFSDFPPTSRSASNA